MPLKAVLGSAAAPQDTSLLALRVQLPPPLPIQRQVFTFKGGDGTADDRPAFPCGKGSPVARSPLAGHWTLPPCPMMVGLRDRARFWDDVRAKADAVGGCASAQGPLQGRDGFLSSASAVRQALAPVLVEPVGQDSEDDDDSPNGLQAFPMIREAGCMKNAHLLWQALTDL